MLCALIEVRTSQKSISTGLSIEPKPVPFSPGTVLTLGIISAGNLPFGTSVGGKPFSSGLLQTDPSVRYNGNPSVRGSWTENSFQIETSLDPYTLRILLQTENPSFRGSDRFFYQNDGAHTVCEMAYFVQAAGASLVLHAYGSTSTTIKDIFHISEFLTSNYHGNVAGGFYINERIIRLRKYVKNQY